MNIDGKMAFFFPKLSWPTVRKKCSSDREKLLQFVAEVWEFAKILRSLEQFIRAMKGQNNFWYQNTFLTFLACFYIPIIFPIWIIIAITSVNKFLFQRMFWPFTVQTYCFSASQNFCKFSNFSLEFQMFLLDH